ncbi:hypothetical protein CRYUN_Cryun08bG0042600 [Craigia yunnanensis]
MQIIKLIKDGVTERSNNQWIAYDCEADRWHPLPKTPTEHDGLQHFGFSFVLTDHSREVDAFGYGFAALRHELYVLGEKVLKWEDSGAGRFDVVRLAGVRVCDPLQRPLNWREIRPMCRPQLAKLASRLPWISKEEKPALLVRLPNKQLVKLLKCWCKCLCADPDVSLEQIQECIEMIQLIP